MLRPTQRMEDSQEGENTGSVWCLMVQVPDFGDKLLTWSLSPFKFYIFIFLYKIWSLRSYVCNTYYAYMFRCFHLRRLSASCTEDRKTGYPDNHMMGTNIYKHEQNIASPRAVGRIDTNLPKRAL